MENFERKTSPKNGIDTENWFIESYRRYKGHPIRILIALYKGNYHKFVMAVICFFIKHACVWVLPIITANIINDVTQKNPDTVRNIWISAALEIGLIALNIPMNYLYTSYKSLATRYAETGLRKALIRKLQQLSIAYHVETQSGRLQSKIMRDVEAVETLSTQMFLSILNIALNIGVALVVTASKSKIVFVFFSVDNSGCGNHDGFVPLGHEKKKYGISKRNGRNICACDGNGGTCPGGKGTRIGGRRST